jgi:hypothetical protein
MRRTHLAAALVVACAACEPRRPPEPPPAPPPAPIPAPPVFAGASGTFKSERFGLRLPLPEGSAWRIDDHAAPWLTATHAATASTLLVRSWTEDGRASIARCEERARLWKALPERLGAEVVQDRAIDAPAGYDTHLLVGLHASHKPGAKITAFALAFGSHAHRCFAFAYTTEAEGPGAERALGERLAAMVEGSMAKVKVDTDLIPRIPREPRR